MSATQPLLELRNVTKRFGGLTAVDRINMTVDAGQIVGIVGPNGSGKTTTFSCVSGFYKPEEGSVLLNGVDVTGKLPFEIARLGIARTFQIVQSFEDMTVLDNVALGALKPESDGTSCSLEQAKAQANEVLRMVGLSEESNKLSGSLGIPGRKRLEIARALASRPQILLLDEVMAGLRPVEVDQAVEMIQEIRSQGITIVVVEHLMRAVVALSEKLYVIHHGALLAEGYEAKEVLSRPEVVEAYFGKATLDA
ncbi:MAG TPA: ABC transporter ATP-binding protein [Burkholderiales bacterium]|jgi:branched-chain amino acid transport system ATP-binding protein|nr:ABC transporter ATP-binding protein [Pseudomonadota bacterium]HCO57951.1 ABC transporter ATP-binding protein [Burkholderiales bacterium]